MAEINLIAPSFSPDDSDEVLAKPGRGPESCVIAWPSRVAPARPAVKYKTGSRKSIPRFKRFIRRFVSSYSNSIPNTLPHYNVIANDALG